MKHVLRHTRTLLARETTQRDKQLKRAACKASVHVLPHKLMQDTLIKGPENRPMKISH